MKSRFLFKPPGLWSLVTASITNQYGLLEGGRSFDVEFVGLSSSRIPTYDDRNFREMGEREHGLKGDEKRLARPAVGCGDN